MPRSHAKIRLKSEPQKLYKKVARSRIVTHTDTALFSIRTTLWETNNILFGKNY